MICGLWIVALCKLECQISSNELVTHRSLAQELQNSLYFMSCFTLSWSAALSSLGCCWEFQYFSPWIIRFPWWLKFLGCRRSIWCWWWLTLIVWIAVSIWVRFLFPLPGRRICFVAMRWHCSSFNPWERDNFENSWTSSQDVEDVRDSPFRPRVHFYLNISRGRSQFFVCQQTQISHSRVKVDIINYVSICSFHSVNNVGCPNIFDWRFFLGLSDLPSSPRVLPWIYLDFFVIEVVLLLFLLLSWDVIWGCSAALRSPCIEVVLLLFAEMSGLV